MSGNDNTTIMIMLAGVCGLGFLCVCSLIGGVWAYKGCYLKELGMTPAEGCPEDALLAASDAPLDSSATIDTSKKYKLVWVSPSDTSKTEQGLKYTFHRTKAEEGGYYLTKVTDGKYFTADKDGKVTFKPTLPSNTKWARWGFSELSTPVTGQKKIKNYGYATKDSKPAYLGQEGGTVGFVTYEWGWQLKKV